MNPLLDIRWEQVGMLSFDDNELTISTRACGVRKFMFASKAELDAAFTQWVLNGKERAFAEVPAMEPVPSPSNRLSSAREPDLRR